MRNIKLFETEAEYNAEKNSLVKPNVSHVRESGHNYFHPYERDYSREYLTYEVLDDGFMIKMVQVQGENVPSAYTISYSLNGGEWLEFPDVDLANPDPSTFVSVSSGDVVRVKGNNNAMCYRIDDSNMSTCIILSFNSTYTPGGIGLNIYGNVMSVLYGDNFIGQTSFPNGSNSNFYGFFSGLGVIDVSNLILPATTLTEDCYAAMFAGCTSLVNAPELPATTLVDKCYEGMFQYCSSLNYIKCLATDISATDCTSSWVHGVASYGLFIKDTNMSSWTTGNNGIPTGWIALEEGETVSGLTLGTDYVQIPSYRPHSISVIALTNTSNPITATTTAVTTLSVEVLPFDSMISFVKITQVDGFVARVEIPVSVTDGNETKTITVRTYSA